MDSTELRDYLKDIYWLESQRYILEKVQEEFQRPIDIYKEYGDFSMEDIRTGDMNYGLARGILGLQGCVFGEYDQILSDPVPRRGYSSVGDYVKHVQGILTRNYLNEQEMKYKKTYTTVSALALDNLEREFFAKKGRPIIIVCALLILISLFIFDGIYAGMCVAGFAFLGVMLFAVMAPGGKGSMDVYIEVGKIKNLIYERMVDVLKENLSVAKENAQTRYRYASRIMDQEIVPVYDQIGKLLDQLYSMGIIRPEYRDMVMISQIYGYIETRRCMGLEGPDGAYYLLDREIGQELVVLEPYRVRELQNRLSNSMLYTLNVIGQMEKIQDIAATSARNAEGSLEFGEYIGNVMEMKEDIKEKYRTEAQEDVVTVM